MKYKIFNVIELESGIVISVTSFVADKAKGENHIKEIENKAIESFKKRIENRLSNNDLIDLESCVENGYYTDNSNYDIYLSES